MSDEEVWEVGTHKCSFSGSESLHGTARYIYSLPRGWETSTSDRVIWVEPQNRFITVRYKVEPRNKEMHIPFIF